ncbi:MAG: phosphoribosylaminoimidazolesuccinocarboxamide synthase [Deltaproteobacteria bacterium]|nr:phosphoribosylaminoimidazolesuccinocarboxamide synthase [Deltaproteobacteria bacterium]
MSGVFQTSLKDIPLLFRGKVRDVYDLGDELLIVTTDRLSAFDVIFDQPIPGKGKVLQSVSDFWMQRLQGIVSNHHAKTKLTDVIKNKEELRLLQGRSCVVKKAKALPVECVVRGYLLGSGYKDYQKSGEVCGIKLPQGLQLAEQLPEPIFTPATKAEQGDHDENISFTQVINTLGSDLAVRLKDISLRLYKEAACFALQKGLIIADTKFEFGLLNDEIILIDEALTPDSSRYWDRSDHKLGESPPSFDKQIVRDYLETLDWDKTPPAPVLPDHIIQRAQKRYEELGCRLDITSQ